MKMLETQVEQHVGRLMGNEERLWG
jgi:hypothetical protein